MNLFTFSLVFLMALMAFCIGMYIGEKIGGFRLAMVARNPDSMPMTRALLLQNGWSPPKRSLG